MNCVIFMFSMSKRQYEEVVKDDEMIWLDTLWNSECTDTYLTDYLSSIQPYRLYYGIYIKDYIVSNNKELIDLIERDSDSTTFQNCLIFIKRSNKFEKDVISIGRDGIFWDYELQKSHPNLFIINHNGYIDDLCQKDDFNIIKYIIKLKNIIKSNWKSINVININ